MIGHLDFAGGAAAVSALVAAVLFPVVLAVLARLPGLRDHNALQFLVGTLIILVLWAIAWGMAGAARPGTAELATSLMILGGALLVYLEAWALLSRGYTLGLLLTLFRSARPMTEAELARSYRQGQGLGWIMRHRLGGLLSTRLVRRKDDCIVLTPAGALIGVLYRMAIAVLGLKVTG
jgi:hypothetical protein